MLNYSIILKLLLLTALLTFSSLPHFCYAQPSLVQVQGKQLIVAKRLTDGSLAPEKPYLIKGVCWSPASKTTVNDHHTRIEDFFSWSKIDIPLIAEMNANTVYTFLDFGLDHKSLEILDQLYQANIMAIITVDWDGTNDLNRIRQVVTKYKNHPAILMWAIGNEWNINLHHHTSSSLRMAAINTEKAARLIKSLDTNHPVASIFGEIIIPNQNPSTKEILNLICPTVDLWGVNIYRGATFGEFFNQWTDLTNKPMFFSEFGTDSYYTNNWWPVRGKEDFLMQANFVSSLWKEIKQHTSANDSSQSCLGGAVFEWVDEWWKVKKNNGGSPAKQDPGGFPTTWNPYSHPDSFANEEYFGIVKLDRQKKPLYSTLQKEFAK